MIGKIILAEHKHENGKYKRVTLSDEEAFHLSQKIAVSNKDIMKQCLILANRLAFEKEIIHLFQHMGDQIGISATVQIAVAMFDKLAPKSFTLMCSTLEKKVFDIKNGNNRGSA